MGYPAWWEMLLAGVAVMVRDKYAVRLEPEQREELQHLIRVGKSSARVTARARILLNPNPPMDGVRTLEGGVRKLQTRWSGLEFG